LRPLKTSEFAWSSPAKTQISKTLGMLRRGIVFKCPHCGADVECLNGSAVGCASASLYPSGKTKVDKRFADWEVDAEWQCSECGEKIEVEEFCK